MKIKMITSLGLSVVLILSNANLVFANQKKIEVERISGKDRYETTENVARRALSLGCDKKYFVVADGENYPDALSAGAKIASTGGLLLLGNENARKLPDDLMKNVNTINVYGGKVKVNEVNVEKTFGKDRFQTSEKIANKTYPNATDYVVVSGKNFADALSGLNIAKKYDAPIILSEVQEIPTKKYIQDKKGHGVGGKSVLNVKGLNEQISGSDRYETNLKTLPKEAKNIIITSGKNYPDALASSSLLGALEKSCLMIVKDTLNKEQIEYIRKNNAKVYIVGGEDSVNKNIVKQIENINTSEETNNTKPNVEGNKAKPPKEEIKKAKEELKKYLDTVDETSLESNAINTEANTKALEDLKKELKRAKELLNDDDIDKEKLEEIQNMPFKKVGKEKKGKFKSLSKKVIVDFKVIGKEITNEHNNRKYKIIEGDKIRIKTSIEDLSNDNTKKSYIKLNYVTDSDYYNAKVDSTSSATPKYKKQEIPTTDYTVKKVGEEYEIEILKMPENAKIIKPVIFVKFAENTYFENGTLVFVQNEITSDKISVKAYTELKDEMLKNALKNVPNGAKITVKSKPKLNKVGEEKAILEVEINGKKNIVEVIVEITNSYALNHIPRPRMVNQINEKTYPEVREGHTINWKNVLEGALKNSLYKKVEVLTIPTEEELKEIGPKSIRYRITFKDDSVREFDLTSLNIVKSNAFENEPEITPLTINYDEELTEEKLKSAITNLTDQMKENEKGYYFRVISKPDVEELKKEGNYSAKVLLVYGDASFREVEISIEVTAKKTMQIELIKNTIAKDEVFYALLSDKNLHPTEGFKVFVSNKSTWEEIENPKIVSSSDPEHADKRTLQIPKDYFKENGDYTIKFIQEGYKDKELSFKVADRVRTVNLSWKNNYVYKDMDSFEIEGEKGCKLDIKFKKWQFSEEYIAVEDKFITEKDGIYTVDLKSIKDKIKDCSQIQFYAKKEGFADSDVIVISYKERESFDKYNIVDFEITKNPYKLKYKEGENFDPKGMEITLKDNKGKTKVIKSDEFASFGVIINQYGVLTKGTKSIVISLGYIYKELNITVDAK